MFKIRYIFLLFLLALFDTFFIYAFPVDFTFQSLSFVSHLCLLMLLVWTAKLEWLDRVLIGALCGILYDFFFVSSFPNAFILYPLLTWLNGLGYQATDKRVVWLYGFSVTGVFLVDFIPYVFYKTLGTIQVGFGIWFVYVEVFTILFHIAALVGYHYLATYMDRNEKLDLQQGRRRERHRIRRLRPMGK